METKNHRKIIYQCLITGLSNWDKYSSKILESVTYLSINAQYHRQRKGYKEILVLIARLDVNQAYITLLSIY